MMTYDEVIASERKLTVSRKNLEKFPEPIREKIEEWSKRYRKRYFYARKTDWVSFREDAHLMMVNLDSGAVKHGRVAGEWAGHVGLDPCGKMPLMEGMMCVEDGIICGGLAMLTVHVGCGVEEPEQVECNAVAEIPAPEPSIQEMIRALSPEKLASLAARIGGAA